MTDRVAVSIIKGTHIQDSRWLLPQACAVGGHGVTHHVPLLHMLNTPCPPPAHAWGVYVTAWLHGYAVGDHYYSAFYIRQTVVVYLASELWCSMYVHNCQAYPQCIANVGRPTSNNNYEYNSRGVLWCTMQVGDNCLLWISAWLDSPWRIPVLFPTHTTRLMAFTDVQVLHQKTMHGVCTFSSLKSI